MRVAQRATSVNRLENPGMDTNLTMSSILARINRRVVLFHTWLLRVRQGLAALQPFVHGRERKGGDEMNRANYRKNICTLLCALSLVGAATVSEAIPVAEVTDGSGGGRDRVVIEVLRGARPDLVPSRQYHLIFRSADPSQDREVVDTGAQTSLGAYEVPVKHAIADNARDLAVPDSGDRTFLLFYYSIFGRFAMHNGRDAWVATKVAPGDVVIVRWGEGA